VQALSPRPAGLFLGAVVLLLATGPALGAGGHDWSLARPDSHAPIGVMGDHLHGEGEWMASYRYAYMDMHGNRDGRSGRSAGDVLQRWLVAPTQMRMTMHVFGLMYAPTDRLTLMTMVPLVRIDMDHVTRMGGKFTTSSDGIGDVKLAGLYGVLHEGPHRGHLNLGLSLPTGSVDEKDYTPMGRQRLPYPMQTGSGTFDLIPGFTYSGQSERYSWGGQALATVRLGDNTHDYRLGNRFHLTGWFARLWTRSLSTSVRLEWQVWGNIHGSDDDLNPLVVPTADPDRRAGSRVDLAFGINWQFRSGPFRGHRIAAEYAVPIDQSLDGPQLETDWRVIVGWQKAF
jgi:hypothetical protein